MNFFVNIGWENVRDHIRWPKDDAVHCRVCAVSKKEVPLALARIASSSSSLLNIRKQILLKI